MSRRAIVPGGVLLRTKSTNDDLELLLHSLQSLLNGKVIYTELRNYYDYHSLQTIFEKQQFHYSVHNNILIDCRKKEEVWQSLSSSKRRQIKQAIAQGVSWGEINDSDEIKQFYDILSALYAERVRRPLFPFSFFESLQNHSSIKVIAVRWQDEIIGGIVCVLWNQQSVSEWFVCGKYRDWETDRKSTRLNSSHRSLSRMPSSA